MRTTFSSLLLALSLVACGGAEDAQTDDVAPSLLQESDLSPQDTNTTPKPTPTSGGKDPCAGSKVKTACKQWQQVDGYIKQ